MTKKEASIVETEQGFNETELENIMSEIESLEEEFVSEGASSTADLAIDKESAPSNDFQDEVDKALNNTEDEDLGSFEKDIAQVNEEISAMTGPQTSQINITTESPIVPTEQVLVVKKKLDTSSIFAELPEENKLPESTFEEAVIESVTAVEMKPSVTSETKEDNVVPFNFNKETKMSTKGNQGNCDTTMNFTVSGQMNLNLNFTVGGQDIQLTISEEEGFCISMGNGVKFSVPIEKTGTMKQRKVS